MPCADFPSSQSILRSRSTRSDAAFHGSRWETKNGRALVHPHGADGRRAQSSLSLSRFGSIHSKSAVGCLTPSSSNSVCRLHIQSSIVVVENDRQGFVASPVLMHGREFETSFLRPKALSPPPSTFIPNLSSITTTNEEEKRHSPNACSYKSDYTA